MIAVQIRQRRADSHRDSLATKACPERGRRIVILRDRAGRYFLLVMFTNEDRRLGDIVTFAVEWCPLQNLVSIIQYPLSPIRVFSFKLFQLLVNHSID
jgi:hypothetical protein